MIVPDFKKKNQICHQKKKKSHLERNSLNRKKDGKSNTLYANDKYKLRNSGCTKYNK